MKKTDAFKFEDWLQMPPDFVGDTEAKNFSSDIFKDLQTNYLNEFTLYLAYFQRIPNFMHEREINCQKALLWFTETYQTEIKDWNFTKVHRRKGMVLDDLFFVLHDDLIVNFDVNADTVRFLFKTTDRNTVESLATEIRLFKRHERKYKRNSVPFIHLIHHGKIKGLDATGCNSKLRGYFIEDFRNQIQFVTLVSDPEFDHAFRAFF
jgi:hypothetical protein